MAVGAARGRRDRAVGAAASHPARTDLQGVRCLPAIRARLGPEVHRPPSPGHPQVPARGLLRRRRRPVQDQPRGRDPLHCAPRPGLEPGNRQGDVLVVARLSPLPPPSGAERAPVGGLRSIDAAMEARNSADLSACRTGAEGSRRLRPKDGDGTARLRHSVVAGQARPAGRRGRDAHAR